jgi:anti-anti-sigma regulatory factor
MSHDKKSESGNGSNHAANGNGNGNGNGKPAITWESRTIALKGPLDKGLDQVEKALGKNVNVILDFSDCHFISVDGLEWLEELLLRADSVGSVVNFVKIHPVQYKVFKVAHIQSLLKACGSPAAHIAPMC